jgi:hypothetical protein
MVTYIQRGHHTLHWLNLRDVTHLPIVEQHYPQFFTRKQTSQLPLTQTRPSRRGQQLQLASPVHTKATTFHVTTMTPTHPPFRHRPSPPMPNTRTRKVLITHYTRRSLRRSHIQCRKVIQILIRRFLCPYNRTPRIIRLKTLRHRIIRIVFSNHGRSRHKIIIDSTDCVRRPKILNMRSNQGSVTQTIFTNAPKLLLSHLRRPGRGRGVFGHRLSHHLWGIFGCRRRGWQRAFTGHGRHICSRGAFTGTRRRHRVDLSFERRADQISKVLDILGTRHLQQQHTHSAKPHIPQHNHTKQQITLTCSIARSDRSLTASRPCGPHIRSKSAPAACVTTWSSASKTSRSKFSSDWSKTS